MIYAKDLPLTRAPSGVTRSYIFWQKAQRGLSIDKIYIREVE
jgi:hypothetical protein